MIVHGTDKALGVFFTAWFHLLQVCIGNIRKPLQVAGLAKNALHCTPVKIEIMQPVPRFTMKSFEVDQLLPM